MKNPPTIALSDATGVPYYRQVVDQIATQIRSGALEPGSSLPSVRQLSVQLKVSLITTRRAYAELEAAGLVVRQQGRGTFVAEHAQPADWAEKRTREIFDKALQESRQLGLDDDAIARIFDSALEGS